MTTMTVKINERSSFGKAFAELLRSTAKESKAVKVIEKEESPYNPEFVKKVLDSYKNDKRTVVNPKDVWGSL